MLFLCYICPPLAVLMMGKPFSAVLNLFLTACLFWIPGIKHALVCYADFKADQKFDQVVDAINHPTHVKARNQAQQTVAAPSSNPYVGRNGTVYGQRS